MLVVEVRHCAHLKGSFGAAEIAQLGKALAAKADGLSSAPGAHLMEERTDS